MLLYFFLLFLIKIAFYEKVRIMKISSEAVKSIVQGVLKELDVPVTPEVEVVTPCIEPDSYNVFVTYRIRIDPYKKEEVEKLVQTVWQQHTNGQVKLELEK